MEVKPRIDRRKHEVDVLEQVMKGIRTERSERGHTPQLKDLSIRRWPGGTVATAVQVEIIDDPDRS